MNGKNDNTIYITTPCLNIANTINQTILSIISQEGNFFIRYHIKDGGSTDRTLQKLEEWQKNLADPNFPYVNCKGVDFTYSSEPDKGMYDAIVKGFAYLDIPETAFMTWLNADDILLPQTLLLADSLRKIKEVAWVTGSLFNFQDDNGLIFNWFVPFPPSEYIARGVCDLTHWACLEQEGTFWRKWLWDKVGGLDNKLRLAGDWDLWRRFAHHADVIQVDYPLGAFRKHSGQLSTIDEGSQYHNEIDSTVPFEERRNAIKEMAEIGTDNLFYKHLNYSGDHYTIIKRAIGNTFPPWCKPFIEELKNVALRKQIKTKSKQYSSLSILPNSFKILNISKVISNSAEHLTDELRKVILLIRSSGLFSYSYYLSNNPDIDQNGMDPVIHYVLFGAEEGRNPNHYFNSKWYLEKNLDVEDARINPLFHYICFGYYEKRDPGPEFSLQAYIEANTDIDFTNLNPLSHYLDLGVYEARSLR